MKKKLLFSLLFLLANAFCFNSKAQEANLKEEFVEAESYFLFEEYKDALPLYQKIIQSEPENYNVLYKIGICYLNDPYQEEKSIKYLAEASKHINPNYKTNSYKEKMAPPEANFYLGQAYRINGQLDKAVESFSTFKQTVNPDLFDIDVVNDEIAACGTAKKLKANPVYLHDENIGSKFNSKYAEDNPVLSGDGKSLVFNRSLPFYDGIFISVKDNSGNWSEPLNLTPDFGLDGDSYVTGISYNGDEIFAYRSDNFDGNLYSSKNVNGKWQKLTKIGGQVNTKYWESHASLSPDGKYLYFTSNRPGGYGGLDIYKAPRLSGNNYGTPVNLGPVINSTYNEDSPFISPDGSKLFFSSLGHDGMGGYDIFVSENTGYGTWSKPVNMGSPVNTTDDDLFFCPVSFNGNGTGIYAKYDPNRTSGLKDIFWAQVYNQMLPRTFTIKGLINTPVPDLLKNGNVKVSLVDSKTGKIAQQLTADEDGNFNLKTNQGNYQLMIDGNGIKPVSVSLELSLTQENSNIQLPTITTQQATKEEITKITPVSQQPKLEIQGSNYILTDTVPVTINLIVEKGSDLSIENYHEAKLQRREEYLISKEKFKYVFTPLAGENKIVFTVHDKDGNTNQQEVTVFYKPKTTEPIASIGPKNVASSLDDVAEIAQGKLKDYLLSVDSLPYDSYFDLYNLLLQNADKNGYSLQDINDLFAVLLTQRTKEDFLYHTSKNNALESINSNDSIIKSSHIPLAIVRKDKIMFPGEVNKINLGLIEIVPLKAKTNKELDYMLSFVNKSYTGPSDLSLTESSAMMDYLIKQSTPKDAELSAELSSTTQELNQFYNNLIMSADEDFKQVLETIDFDSTGIRNSIDLVKYLFNLSSQGKIPAENVVRNLERARQEEKMNLEKLKEAFANAASGELKVAIQDIDINKDNIHRLTDIIDLLLRDSQVKGYGKNEVYSLLVSMVDVPKVDDFINEMLKYAQGDLKKLLTNIDKSQYSTPLEVVQYLLSQTGNFDFTDSDINNLLLRMLLEKGLNRWQDEDKSYLENQMKHRRMIATICLGNLILILLIIIFWRRRKKKKQQ